VNAFEATRAHIGLNAHLLYLGHTYRAAGVSRYIQGLLNHLPAADGQLGYHAFLGASTPAFRGWTCHRTPWPTGNPAIRIVWEQVLQPWEIKRHRLDLLHVPASVGPMWVQCPLVVSIHDLSIYRYPDFFRPANRHYLQAFTRATARRADRILASSEHTRRDVIDILSVPPERVEVVHLGIDERMMRPQTDAQRMEQFRRRRSLPERIILFVGTLEPRKNLPTLIAAYGRLVARHHIPHTLVVAGGKGWYYEHIEEAVQRLGLTERVIFPGYVPDEELPMWYSAADLFVYPSLYEGFGFPPLEAMACGTPVVVADTSSLPEVVGRAGLLFPPDDVEALAEIMYHMLEDEGLRARCRAEGLDRAQSFTWRHVAERTTQIYHSVLGSE